MTFKIEMVVFDVDGVMTDGTVGVTETGEHIKFYNKKDGWGIAKLLKNGIKVGILTADPEKLIKPRMVHLGIDKNYCIYQSQDKGDDIKKLATKANVELRNIAYMGDDEKDLAAMRHVGFKGCPKDAVEAVKMYVQYKSEFKGGKGAVRDFCDTILDMNGQNY